MEELNLRVYFRGDKAELIIDDPSIEVAVEDGKVYLVKKKPTSQSLPPYSLELVRRNSPDHAMYKGVFNRECSLREVLEEILQGIRFWGSITIVHLKLGSIRVDYKKGVITPENVISDYFMECIVERLACEGGWGQSNYTIYLK